MPLSLTTMEIGFQAAHIHGGRACIGSCGWCGGCGWHGHGGIHLFTNLLSEMRRYAGLEERCIEETGRRTGLGLPYRELRLGLFIITGITLTHVLALALLSIPIFEGQQGITLWPSF